MGVQFGGYAALLGMMVVVILEVCSAREIMTNNWYVQLHGDHGMDVAKSIAKRNGFQFVNSVSVNM